MLFSQSNRGRPLRWLLAVALFSLAGAASAINWNFLEGPHGGQPLALFNDPAGNTWAGMNGSGVYFRAAGTQAWVLRPELPTQANAKFTSDAAGTVYVSGSSGLYKYPAGASTWTKVSGTGGLPNEAASGLTTDTAGTIYAAMNQSDVYKLTAGQSNWVQAGTGLPPGSLPNDLTTDSAGNLWAAISGSGIFKLAAGTSTWLAASTGLAQLSVTSLERVGIDLYAGLQSGGVALLANPANGNTTWVPWTGGDLGGGDDVYDFTVGSNNTVYAAGFGAVFAAPAGSTAWMRVGTGIDAQGPGYAIVAGADGSLTLGNGGGVFVLPAAGGNWERATLGMSAATIYGMAVAPNGDVYAATFGLGVQRQPAGTATWTEVDPPNSHPVAGTIVVDAQGTVYATPGGAVKKLVNGVWVQAGTGQNAFAYALAIDGSNTVWAGLAGGVRKLTAGSTAWTNTGGGLLFNRSISSIAVDAAGNAYAGIYGTGVYVLPAGTSTWSLNINGFEDVNVQVLQRDPGGAIYAGTDAGVFKLVSGTWQKHGNGDLMFVTALAFDPDGNAYAGTDSQGAFLLPAGTFNWLPLPLGLGSRSVHSVAYGAGRIYAGTDGSRGTPSGAFVLSLADTIVEFYNDILDHYFVTASAAEQQAILGGSAGPGWSTTGAIFSAGGPSTVCRFYGSISPGPNSHFYTIDPNECQQLKDLQQTTPPELKRWNFESNDFASSTTVGGGCHADKVPVYRAYNNGFTQGIDSNHRITSSLSGYQQTLARGWVGEGIVMCAPK